MEGKNTFSLLVPFPPIIFLKPPIFPFALKVLFYRGPRLLLPHFFSFLRSINYACASQFDESSTPTLSIRFWLKLWFLLSPWNYGVAHGHHLRAPSRISERRTAFGVISRFDPNIASSWWRTWNSRGARSSWSWTSSSLVLLYFSEFSHLGDLVASRPRFRWRTWNRMWRLLRHQRHFYLRMVFSSWRWTLPLVAWSDLLTAS
jgi:hypothetical protein